MGSAQAVMMGGYPTASVLVAPTLVDVGDSLGGAGAPTYTFVTQGLDALVENDVLFALINTGNETPPGAPSGWTYLTSYGSGTPAAIGAVGLHSAWYRVPASPATSVSFGDSGDHTFIRVYQVRGCRTNAAPVVNLGGISDNTSEPITIPTGTTTSANNLILYAISHGEDDAQGFITSWSIPNVTGGATTHTTGYGTTLGNGGGIASYTGVLAAAGGDMGSPTVDVTALTQPLEFARATYAFIPVGG